MVSAPKNDDNDDDAKTAYDARKRSVWDDVDDLRGDAHYVALGVRREATRDELKSAFIRAAREHHPDKGGDARTFAKVRKAYEVLSDPAKRRTYDSLMTEIQYRYIRGVTQRAPGGEAALVAEALAALREVSRFAKRRAASCFFAKWSRVAPRTTPRLRLPAKAGLCSQRTARGGM